MLEFIVATPIFVILLFAIVEFALLLSNLQQVKQASRAGAHLAAELSTAQLSSGVDANNITLVDNEVVKVLSSAGIARCQVILDYNATCGGIVPGTKMAGGGCSGGACTPVGSLPSLVDVPGGSVRVTVCVPVTQLTPNMLATFGFSVANLTAASSTILPYENCP